MLILWPEVELSKMDKNFIFQKNNTIIIRADR
jgi:hypothetical protein